MCVLFRGPTHFSATCLVLMFGVCPPATVLHLRRCMPENIDEPSRPRVRAPLPSHSAVQTHPILCMVSPCRGPPYVMPAIIDDAFRPRVPACTIFEPSAVQTQTHPMLCVMSPSRGPPSEIRASAYASNHRRSIEAARVLSPVLSRSAVQRSHIMLGGMRLLAAVLRLGVCMSATIDRLASRPRVRVSGCGPRVAGGHRDQTSACSHG